MNIKNLVKFNNQALFEQALTHRSFLNEAGDKTVRSNERLEFLGDAILDFSVSAWLYQKFPDYPEGTLTNLRSNLVNTLSLAKLAGYLQIGELIQMSRGEKESGGQQNPSLLANTMEAIIGAIFLDQGLIPTEAFIKKQLQASLKEILARGEFKDYKSLLQEKVQSQTGQPPVYEVLHEQGPDHAKTFMMAVLRQGKRLATASGKSKQRAEQEAARLALEKLASRK
ncbi:ribonuclease III [Candidatus Shapirobacteria bacterium CG10_big_fil_rev_8_21_14_0_10_48_15]|uniref:Ribonuclease 3 n=1 Tax=Candidatus Shapirobacteria bacterium CG10_big_fil_rev_8_21_14_0_10_48_15 TaxID=1974484 RepID=A0A2M8L771_9BACT|nr:MAG: ribonuclease III [Candidatus Shapirobacteria bacterium CG10_big_fil_rev_8_21_14_0_10_48_15]